MKYIKELDAIRAIAALMVIFNHWIPQHYSVSKIPFAALGVTIFFLLSGFLITWILLENKSQVEEGNLTNSSFLKVFYIRRSLRIFPIYYLTVFVLFFAYRFLGSELDLNLTYFLTYTSNFYFFKLQSFNALGSHLWSLAIEEQFYLLWPIVILLTKRKYLIHIIILFIVVGIISEFLLRDNVYGFLITTSCFYVFGLGALLAWFVVFNRTGLKMLYQVAKVFGMVGVIFYTAYILGIDMGFKMYNNRPIDCMLAFFLLSFILFYYFNKKRLPLAFIWQNRYLMSIGKVSYSIYLYHPFVAIAVYKAMSFFKIDLNVFFQRQIAEFVYLAICFICLLIASALSWVLIEKPLLSLKRFFVYEEKSHFGKTAEIYGEVITNRKK